MLDRISNAPATSKNNYITGINLFGYCALIAGINWLINIVLWNIRKVFFKKTSLSNSNRNITDIIVALLKKEPEIFSLLVLRTTQAVFRIIKLVIQLILKPLPPLFAASRIRKIYVLIHTFIR